MSAKNGWTGGQHSLWRVALALALACSACAACAVSTTGALVAIPVALALAIGWRDRGMALAAIAVLIGSRALAVAGADPVMFGFPRDAFADGLLMGLLALHAATPRAPFLSFEARVRADPGGGWTRPGWIGELAWALPVGALVFLPLAGEAIAPGQPGAAPGNADAGSSALAASLAAAFAVSSWIGFAVRAWRPTLWSVLALASIGFACLDGVDRLDGAALLALALAADPGWWPGRARRRTLGPDSIPRSQPAPAHLFYDGDCGFCHRSVRFILAEELGTPPELRTRFAPLASETYRAHLARHPELDPAALPDSIVFELEDGTILTRSAAVLEIASRLGGIWRGIARIAAPLPQGLLDRAYDAIARIRKRLFAQPKDACPILPPILRARFDG